MKRCQLSMETLENRELLTTIVEPVTGYTYDTVGNRLSITDDSGVEDRGGSDTQIYTLEILDVEPATQNQLWGDWFLIDDTSVDANMQALLDGILAEMHESSEVVIRSMR